MEGKPETLLQQPHVGFKAIWTTVRGGWTSHVQAWKRPDWLAGLQPLPRDMASHLAAIAIVTALVLTSLSYGDAYQRRIMEAHAIASGEHPLYSALPHETPEAEPNSAPAETVPKPATSAPAATPALPPLGEPFIERFEGDELSERWFVSDGWSNGDWMDNDWRASQVTLGENGLALTMEPAPEGSEKILKSAEFRTHEFFRYGYFEIQMRVPRDTGIVTGFFTYAHTDGKTQSNEIDIEILGRNTRLLEATIHENGKSNHTVVQLPFDAADGFHTYGFDWRADSVRWYADGKMIHEVKGDAAARLVRPQQLIVDLWATHKLNEWVGPLNISDGPWKLDVACIAYHPVAPRGRPLCD